MGKYIKKFDTHSDYEDFTETEDFIRPNVSYCVDNKDVHYNSTQTLFAVEFESGKFAFGHASEDEIFVATRDGLAQIWYADANGVITGYTPTADNVASAIIDAYNEHFGTGINIWTPETINLQVGDTVPNWNAYDKIEIPIRRIAVNMLSAQQEAEYIVGQIDGDTFKVMVNSFGAIVTNNNGLIIENVKPSKAAPAYIKTILSNFGIEVSKVQSELVDYVVNEYVPNWVKFEIYT